MAAWPTAASAAEAAQSAGNPALVSQIASHLAQAKGVRAQFTQTQTLAAMKQPLVSTGSLLFFRDRGVIWQIDTPYKATYVITDAGVAEVDANGQRVTAPQRPGHTRRRAGLEDDARDAGRRSVGAVLAIRRAGRRQRRAVAHATHAEPAADRAVDQRLADERRRLPPTLRITLANGDITKLDFAKSAAVTELPPAERRLFGAP